MNARRRTCTDQVTVGRLRKSIQFLQAAEMVRDLADDRDDVGDAFVTLCVHAGIAASDAICCRDLGEHAQGEDHVEATNLVRQVRPDGPDLASALGVLLGMKTRADYGAESVSGEQQTRAYRRAKQLVDAARQRVGT